MMKQQFSSAGTAYQQLVRLIWNFLVISAFVFLLATTALCEASIPNEFREVFRALVFAVSRDSQITDQALKRVGFPPDNQLKEEWRAWRKWPDERKLEAAYIAAEEGKKGQGELLIRFIARSVAQEVDTIRDEKALAKFFPEYRAAGLPSEAPPKDFTFKLSTSGNFVKRAPEHVQEMIKAITRHSGSYPGGLPHLFARCCGIHNDRAYDILRKSSSIENAVERAIVEGTLPPVLKEKLINALKEVSRYNIAVNYDQFGQYADTVKAFLEPKSPIVATGRKLLVTMRKIYGEEVADQTRMTDKEVIDLLSQRYTMEDMDKIIDSGKNYLRSQSRSSTKSKYEDALQYQYPSSTLKFVGKDKFGREMFLIDDYLKAVSDTKVCPIYVLP